MAVADENFGIVPALVRSSFLVDAVYAESAREHGLTPHQGRLLCVLMPQPYGMSELGAMLGLAKSSLTELVDRTMRRELVRREPNPADRRAVQVALTEQGAALAAAFYDAATRRLAELPSGLDDAEQETLAALLSRVVRDNRVPTIW
jgi:DNA-binding MarR family transcriptional regulator